MLLAARATSGNHGSGIYHCSWVYLKNVPVVSFDLRCQSGISILSSMYHSLAITILTVIRTY